uniref:Uncharacterized protein n=1 Tax=Solanum tuberosum TaxID=4113 RepID=M1DKZ2_SOLTU
MEQRRLLTVLAGARWLSGLLPGGVGFVDRSCWSLLLRLGSLPRWRKMEGKHRLLLVPLGTVVDSSESLTGAATDVAGGLLDGEETIACLVELLSTGKGRRGGQCLLVLALLLLHRRRKESKEAEGHLASGALAGCSEKRREGLSGAREKGEEE